MDLKKFFADLKKIGCLDIVRKSGGYEILGNPSIIEMSMHLDDDSNHIISRSYFTCSPEERIHDLFQNIVDLFVRYIICLFLI